MDGQAAANSSGTALCSLSSFISSPTICWASALLPPLPQEVLGYGRPGDVLLGLSTSGNSGNVINAVKTARAAGLRCIGLGGLGGGMLRELCDVYVALPESETYLVQELTLPVYLFHLIRSVSSSFCTTSFT